MSGSLPLFIACSYSAIRTSLVCNACLLLKLKEPVTRKLELRKRACTTLAD